MKTLFLYEENSFPHNSYTVFVTFSRSSSLFKLVFLSEYTTTSTNFTDAHFFMSNTTPIIFPRSLPTQSNPSACMFIQSLTEMFFLNFDQFEKPYFPIFFAYNFRILTAIRLLYLCRLSASSPFFVSLLMSPTATFFRHSYFCLWLHSHRFFFL